MLSEKDILNYIVTSKFYLITAYVIQKEQEDNSNDDGSCSLLKDSSIQSTSRRVHERLYNDYMRKLKIKEKIVETRDVEGLAECTFKPNLSSTTYSIGGQSAAKRTIDEFYTEMIRYKEKKERKVEENKRI